MLIHIFTLCSLVISVVLGQLVSPCPGVLDYEARNANESDRWYGVLLLKSEEDLEGVWLRVYLDRSADLLGNWFGEVQSSNNIEYTIKNPSYRLEAGPPVSVRFFVKYNAASIVPTVSRVVLNGKTICPVSKKTENELFLSNKKKDEGPGVINLNINGQGATPRPPTRSGPVSVPIPNIPCGTTAVPASPLISHGQKTSPGQWPWHIALYYARGLELDYQCGGTLISEDFVVLAAHCVVELETNQLVNVQSLLVYLGKHTLSNFGPEVQDRKVQQILTHHDFNTTLFYNDIALLKLDRPAIITNYVRKCCLWEGQSNLQDIVGKFGTVVGWGLDETNVLSNTLLQTKYPVVSVAQCVFSNRIFFSQFISDSNYCAGFGNGTSVCNGDSGGSMVFPKPGTSGTSTVWQIRGLVSISVALPEKRTCDPSYYTIFTDVSKYIPWIKRITNL